MTIAVYNITGTAWTPITAAGLSGTCWLQEIPNNGQVSINHSDTLTEFDISESFFMLNAKRKQEFLGAESKLDIYYARCSIPEATAVLVADTGPGFIGDPLGKVIPEANGAWPVNVQDQTSPPFDLYMIKATAAPTTIATNADIDDLTVTLTDATGFTDGTYVGIFHPSENRFYFGEQLGAPVGNDITLDTPLDFAFPAGDNVLAFSRDLNVDGSGTTQVFEIQGPGGDAAIDITRIMIQMTTSAAPSFNAFGDIAGGLTNGIVLRRVNGDVRNVWNIKLNLEFANHAYDYSTYVATNPGQGVWGIAIRYTFAGQDKHGVAVRLEKGESLELWVQDDLSDLLSFRIIAQGHIVTD